MRSKLLNPGRPESIVIAVAPDSTIKWNGEPITYEDTIARLEVRRVTPNQDFPDD